MKQILRVCLSFTMLFYALTGHACGENTGTVCPPDTTTFQSDPSTHALNIVMIAQQQPAKRFDLFNQLYFGVQPWTYLVCHSSDYNPDSKKCKNAVSVDDQYAGPFLQLNAGDTLNIKLINRLPLAINIANLEDVPYLNLNPTNLHTHGLIVSPHVPYIGNETYGDNIFVMLFNSANGIYPSDSTHNHGAVVYNSIDYSIYIPPSHPFGLYWIHPHLHGLTSAQVTAGMRGIITIGHVSDYVTVPGWATTEQVYQNTSYLALQDSQIVPTGSPPFTPPIAAALNTNPDPAFCTAVPDASEGGKLRHGSCPGSNFTASGGSDYTGGTWYHPVSGQIYPSIKITGQQIFAIANVSDSSTYNIQLRNASDQNPDCHMLMQILSVDGVAIDASNIQTLLMAAGGKFIPEMCPEASYSNLAICTRSILMMPSARVEVLAAYRNGGKCNKLATVPITGASAVLETTAYNTGPGGDSWPAVDLASIQFAPHTKGELATVITPPYDINAIAKQLAFQNKQVQTDPKCQPLPPGYKRRVFYGNPQSNPNEFGLAYETIDQNGMVVGLPAKDLQPYSSLNSSICIPMAPHNKPASEQWELVNVATENHNFHIHQQKFQLISQTDILTGEVVPSSSAYLLDNVPLPHAINNCGQNDGSNPITDWRLGLCKSSVLTVQLNFAIAGTFVYHCHILQHEDGGMMANIQIVPSSSV